MKRFNLEEYLANPSRKVVTRDGRTIRKILCTDAESNYPVIALVKSKDGSDEYPLRYTTKGQYCPGSGKNEDLDLFFAPEKKEGWINIFRSITDGNIYIGNYFRIYESKEDAEKAGKDWEGYITTTKIEWEE